MQETLRFPGKILGARVTRQADPWFLSVQVDVPDTRYYRHRTGNGIDGADVGMKTFATLSDGEKITRKMQAAKMSIGLTPKAPIPSGTRLPRSRNWLKAQDRLAHTHRRVVNIRSDFLYKTSTRLCRENQAIGIETLSVEGMMHNHHVARAIADQGLGQFFTMLQYKAERYGTQLVPADRWFPSSKLCSTPGCGYLQKDLTLTDREWICPSCGTGHDRDVNAAQNLARLATATALPVAT